MAGSSYRLHADDTEPPPPELPGTPQRPHFPHAHSPLPPSPGAQSSSSTPPQSPAGSVESTSRVSLGHQVVVQLKVSTFASKLKSRTRINRTADNEDWLFSGRASGVGRSSSASVGGGPGAAARTGAGVGGLELAPAPSPARLERDDGGVRVQMLEGGEFEGGEEQQQQQHEQPEPGMLEPPPSRIRDRRVGISPILGEAAEEAAEAEGERLSPERQRSEASEKKSAEEQWRSLRGSVIDYGPEHPTGGNLKLRAILAFQRHRRRRKHKVTLSQSLSKLAGGKDSKPEPPLGGGAAGSDGGSRLFVSGQRVLRRQAPLRRAWTLGIDCLAMVQLICIPLAWSFCMRPAQECNRTAPGGGTEWSASMESFITASELFFWLDVLVDLRTTRRGYNGDDNELQSPAEVGRYCCLQWWFAVNVLSLLGLPLSYVWDPLLLLVLLRICRYMTTSSFTVTNLLELSRLAPVWRLFRIFVFFVLATHWIACLLYALLRVGVLGCVQQSIADHPQGLYGDHPECWVKSFRPPAADLNDVNGTRISAEELLHGGQFLAGHEQYVISLHMALLLMIGEPTGSFGDESWRIFAMTMLFFGSFFCSVIFGNAAVFMASLNVERKRYSEKMDTVADRLRKMNVPMHTQHKVQEYYKYVWSQFRSWDPDMRSRLVEDLPASLQSEVGLGVYYQLVLSVPFFHGCDAEFVTELVTRLRPVLFIPADSIVQEGEVGCEMYFVIAGSVECFFESKPQKILRTIGRGEFFGEIAIIMDDSVRTASIRAATHCTLASLRKSDLDELLQNWPEVKLILAQHVKKQKHVKNTNIQRGVSARRQRILRMANGGRTSSSGSSQASEMILSELRLCLDEFAGDVAAQFEAADARYARIEEKLQMLTSAASSSSKAWTLTGRSPTSPGPPESLTQLAETLRRREN